MEIKNYIRVITRWGWLLLLALALGVAAGYVISLYQKPVYRSTTLILIQKPSGDQVDNPFNLNDKQFSQTFTELIATGPIFQRTSERLGYPISSSQVVVEAVPQTDLIRITVENNDPRRAADIANTLVNVFIEENANVQASRYASAEESLQTQITDFEQRISDLQSQLNQLTEDRYNEQVDEVTQTIANLQAEIGALQEDVVRLDYVINPPDPRNPYRYSTAPTPSVEQRLEYVQKQDRLNELKSLLGMYQKIYVDLTNSSGSNASPSSRRADQIQAALNQYVQNYSILLNNMDNLRLARMRATPNVIQVEQAMQANRPIRPVPLVNMVLGGVVGLMLAGGFSFIREYLDDTLRTPEEVTQVLQLPVLGYIGDMQSPRLKNERGKMPYVLAAPRSPVTEAFRSLRANIEFAELDDKPIKTLLITSSTLSEGKTTVAVNLAIVMAQLGRKVVLVDADLRRPRVHHALGISNLAGLSDVLRKQATIQEVGHTWGNGNLVVITSGSLPPNPAEVLSSNKMTAIMEELKNQADIVVIDSPPFLLADASALAARSDGVLLVVQSNKTHLHAAMSMVEQLQRVGAHVIGVALNRMDAKGTYYYEDLKNYASYAYDVERTQPSKKRP
jgi:polysaccharide biosynthesis transport protein